MQCECQSQIRKQEDEGKREVHLWNEKIYLVCNHMVNELL